MELSVNEEFMLDIPVYNYNRYIFYFDENGVIKSDFGAVNSNEILRLIEKHPDLIIKKDYLNENELAICKIFNADWVTRDETETFAEHSCVRLWQGKNRPRKYDAIFDGEKYVATIMDTYFPSVEKGSCIQVKVMEGD